MAFVMSLRCGVIVALIGTMLELTTTVSAMVMSGTKSDFAVVGCGVLGTSLCRQLLRSPAFGARTVTGITKTQNRHALILSDLANPESQGVIKVTTSEEVYKDDTIKFRDVVFCAPPSGFDDYPRAVEDAVTKLWAGPEGGGTFVFTSSGGVYAGTSSDGTPVTVNEGSPVQDTPRAQKLLDAERVCLAHGGTVLRLAGLYTLERGAHNYWLEGKGREVAGRADGVVNLLHYDDAAHACLTATLFPRHDQHDDKPRICLISDGNPLTRQRICESALQAGRYAQATMPVFRGNDTDDLGKVYDGTWSNDRLQWQPTFAASFDEFMASHR